MAINQTKGKSVYFTQDDPALNPPYFVAQQLIPRYSRTKHLLELAGGALYSSGPFSNKGYTLTSLELDDSLIAYVKRKYPRVTVIKTDLDQPLPPIPQIKKVDFVLVLDVFEHFTPQRVISLLTELKHQIKPRPFHLLVSMPTISWKSLNTYFELLKSLSHFSRPQKGLFDPTHKIFTDTAGHLKLFAAAGYHPVEQFTENALDYLSGDWPALDRSRLFWDNDPHKPQNKKLFLLHLLSQLLPAPKRKSFLKYHSTSRGLYLLTPN